MLALPLGCGNRILQVGAQGKVRVGYLNGIIEKIGMGAAFESRVF